MIARRQIPVYSPIHPRAFAPAVRAAVTRRTSEREALARELIDRFSARAVALTDSGTSALVLALRAVAGAGGTVALPGYACADLVAAAIRARVRVRLYDIDPVTLAPDLESLSRVLDRGARAVVVVHLYGFPVDMPEVIALAASRGASVVEDAAQGAGGTLHGRPLGSFGPLTVLSFGRGKGITGGNGGALLAVTGEHAADVESFAAGHHVPSGWRDLATAAAQWIFGRPAVYAIPSAVPGLRLGEMVYRPAHEPRSISAAAAVLVRRAFGSVAREVAIRRHNAAILMRAVDEGSGLRAIRALPEGNPAYIRFTVRDLRHRHPDRRAGIVRAYPWGLIEQPEIRECLEPHQEPLPGAAELGRSLFTLPVHSLVDRRDLDTLCSWLRTTGVRDRATESVPLERLEATTARFIRRF